MTRCQRQPLWRGLCDGQGHAVGEMTCRQVVVKASTDPNRCICNAWRCTSKSDAEQSVRLAYQCFAAKCSCQAAKWQPRSRIDLKEHLSKPPMRVIPHQLQEELSRGLQQVKEAGSQVHALLAWEGLEGQQARHLAGKHQHQHPGRGGGGEKSPLEEQCHFQQLEERQLRAEIATLTSKVRGSGS